MGTPLGGSNRPRAPFSPTAGHYFCPKYRDTARLGVRSDRRGLEPAVETCHDSTDVVHHDQLTNAALARPGSVHLGNRPRMSSERDNCLRRADNANQRAAQATEPSIKSAYEKVAEHWMLLARLESLLAAEKESPGRAGAFKELTYREIQGSR